MKTISLIFGLTLAGAAVPALAQTPPDPVMGQKQFGQCTVCHTVQAKGPNGVGPNLFGIFGSVAGARPDKFAYSPELKASKIKWDDDTLDKWITDPAAMVKGTKMTFIGIPRKPVRQNIIAYLKTLK